MSEETPEIQVDSDWKAEAQAEKERLAATEEKQAENGPRGLPPADFKGLMGILASQAMMGLGMVQDPGGKGVMVDLEGSKFAIDLLDVLQQKTTGNLSDEEVLGQVLDTVFFPGTYNSRQKSGRKLFAALNLQW